MRTIGDKSLQALSKLTYSTDWVFSGIYDDLAFVKEAKPIQLYVV